MQPEKRRTKTSSAAVIRQQLDSAFNLPSSAPAAAPEDPPEESPPEDDPPSTVDFPEAEPPDEPVPTIPLHPKPSARPSESEDPPLQDEASQVAALVRDKLGEKIHQHYFAGRTSFRVEQDEVVIGVGSPFLLSWMQKQFRSLIAETARMILGPSARLRFEVDSRLADELSGRDPKTVDVPPNNEAKGNHKPPRSSEAGKADSSKTKPATVRPGRHFARLEDFIGGDNSALAVTAVEEVCKCPGEQYNPLYLHGGVGLGKTHLMEGIYRRLRSRHPALKVLYLTAEAFTNYFTEALREKTLPSFRQRFRNINVLLVDDLDFLESKRGIQDEFLHTFKQLERQGGQLVLSADRHPRLLPNLSEELMTRCLSGLVCRLEAPDQAARVKIALAYSARQNANLSEEVLEFIANRFSRNVRELQGAINTLATYARMTKRRVSLSAARRVLADLERDCTRIVRMADVEQTVCQFFGVSPVDLKSGKRIRTLTQPRMLAMFLIRKHTGAAYQEIGQYFGGRNHATVISAEKKVLGWLSDKTPMKIAAEAWPIEEVVEALERQLQAG